MFLSSRAAPDDKRTAFSLGAVDYVLKPYQPSLLLERIKAHLLDNGAAA